MKLDKNLDVSVLESSYYGGDCDICGKASRCLRILGDNFSLHFNACENCLQKTFKPKEQTEKELGETKISQCCKCRKYTKRIYEVKSLTYDYGTDYWTSYWCEDCFNKATWMGLENEKK